MSSIEPSPVAAAAAAAAAPPPPPPPPTHDDNNTVRDTSRGGQSLDPNASAVLAAVKSTPHSHRRTTNMTPVWVTQGRTEHSASMFIGEVKMMKRNNKAETAEEEHVLVKWTTTENTEYVPMSTVRQLIDGEKRRRHTVLPIYNAAPSTKNRVLAKKETQSSNRDLITTKHGPKSSVAKSKSIKSSASSANNNHKHVKTPFMFKKKVSNMELWSPESSDHWVAVNPPHSEVRNYYPSFDQDEEDWSESSVQQHQHTETTDFSRKRHRQHDNLVEQPWKINRVKRQKGEFSRPNVGGHHENPLQSETSLYDDEEGTIRDEESYVEQTTNAEASAGTGKELSQNARNCSNSSFDPKLTIENYNISSHDSFPMELFKLLKDSTKLRIDHIISWEADGKSFRIHREDIFLRLLMCVSNNRKLKSFRNTLSKFGFKCFDYGEYGRAYTHVSALRPKHPAKQETAVLFHRHASMKSIQAIHRQHSRNKTTIETQKAGRGNNGRDKKTNGNSEDDNLRTAHAITQTGSVESLQKQNNGQHSSKSRRTLPAVDKFVLTSSLQERFRLKKISSPAEDKSNSNKKKRNFDAMAKDSSDFTKASRVSGQKRKSNLEKRRLSNGCLPPKKSALSKQRDGTLAKPRGGVPKGTGRYPEYSLSKSSGDRKITASKSRPSPAMTNESRVDSSDDDPLYVLFAEDSSSVEGDPSPKGKHIAKKRRSNKRQPRPEAGSTRKRGNGTWVNPTVCTPKEMRWDLERGLRVPFRERQTLDSDCRVDSSDDDSLWVSSEADHDSVEDITSKSKHLKKTGKRREHKVCRTDDGSLFSRRSRIQKENGSYSKSKRAKPHKLVWDPIRGLWAPKGSMPSEAPAEVSTSYPLVVGQTSSSDDVAPHFVDESQYHDRTVVRMSPTGKHFALRTSPMFPTFLMFKKRHVFKGTFTAKTKANPTGLIGGDNQIMKGVNKENYAKIHQLIQRRRLEKNESKSDISMSLLSETPQVIASPGSDICHF